MADVRLPSNARQAAIGFEAADGRGPGHVIARSAAMREIVALVGRVAGADVPVLILGEIGVGRQAIAREIHRQSRRAANAFVHVLCGALRESDLEQRLFGRSCDRSRSEPGAAVSLFEASQGGTLFLDGLAQLPLWAQVKLLDALQRGVGPRREADGPGGVPPRVIASSKCDLGVAVSQGRFFSGLYYYLNAVRIEVPPLRHRQDEIIPLAEHFLALAVPALGPPRDQFAWRFSWEARQALLQYDWPGNVMQLATVVTHAAMLAEGPEIKLAGVARLLENVRRGADSAETILVPAGGGLREVELAFVKETIRRCGGNKAAASRALGLHRRTLYRLLEQ